ncbi:TlpA family protein disulfide reductase [Pedobacter borealis]|uniref:TlpA family protein disulfide reductase n=1 Tax=Pedobacter borealis TaxID=475254 RepID=UPI0004937770|nr:TlpA disulfide reductase family protein [Pedobacter borealis]
MQNLNSFTDFSLPDTQGKQVSLSSMKDKVVILDFWYTGCSNCVKLKKAMEPIYNQFYANEHVRFVSIIIDQDRSGWLNSVKGGSYTNPEDINLYTAGEGAKHPVIRDNLISGYPTLYVLKNEKTHSSSTPKLGTPAGRAAFSQLILDAILK